MLGENVFITNNVPYIIELEDGHSKRQAPAGMVAVTFANLNAMMFGATA